VFRVRFQFSIRSLLLLTVAVAVPSSWLATELRAARAQRQALDALGAIKPAVASGCGAWDYERDEGWPPKPEWLLHVFGHDFFHDVITLDVSTTFVTDADVEHLKALPRLRFLTIGLVTKPGVTDRASNPRITDAALKHIEGLTQLENLDLQRTNVTGAGLERLHRLTRLRWLNLRSTLVSDAGLRHVRGLTTLDVLTLDKTKVTDAGLEHLKPLTELSVLSLANTQVTDAGLQHLRGLTKLKVLLLAGTQVTQAGKEDLRQSLPGCDMDYRVPEVRRW
jgi:hypothetical protein